MSTKKNILIISYLFDPDKTVGSKRATFWAKNINKIAPYINCDVISITENTHVDGVENYYCIPNLKKAKGLIKDEGVTWKKEIRKWMKTNETGYDVVIMSGSPFMYFSLVKDFQKKGAKVILDYRDPFANNPRFNNTFFKVFIKSQFENRFNKVADKIITVNQFCLPLLKGYKKGNNKYSVIKNGYERVAKSTDVFLNRTTINFIYTGTFFPDRDPKPLLKIIKENKEITFHHIGRETTLNEPYKMACYGMLPYSKMLKGINDSDIGIILSSGLSFESTTKIYDYIYMKKPIWVISNKEIKNGGIWDELKDYPAVVWSLNNDEAIQKDLPTVLKLVNKDINIDTSQYSREAGLIQLVQLIKELC